MVYMYYKNLVLHSLFQNSISASTPLPVEKCGSFSRFHALGETLFIYQSALIHIGATVVVLYVFVVACIVLCARVLLYVYSVMCMRSISFFFLLSHSTKTLLCSRNKRRSRKEQ